MAKNKMIHTVLHLRDNIAGELLTAAKNAKTVSGGLLHLRYAIMRWKKHAAVSVAAAKQGIGKRTLTERMQVAAVETDSFKTHGFKEMQRQLEAVTKDTVRAGGAMQEALARITRVLSAGSRAAIGKDYSRSAGKQDSTAASSKTAAVAVLRSPKDSRLLRYDRMPIAQVMKKADERGRAWEKVQFHHAVGAGSFPKMQGCGEFVKVGFAKYGSEAVTGKRLIRSKDETKRLAGRLQGRVKTHAVNMKNSIIGAANNVTTIVSEIPPWLGAAVGHNLQPAGRDIRIGQRIGRVVNPVGMMHRAASVTSCWRGGNSMNLPLIPHDVSLRAAGSAPVHVQVVVQGNMIGNRAFADEMGEIICTRIRKALDNT